MSCCVVAKESSLSILKNICQPSKGIPVALTVIALIGIAAAGVGFAALGAHQGWWAAGTISQMTQVQAIAMVASGGALGIGAIVFAALSVALCRKKTPDLWTTLDSLKETTVPYADAVGFYDAYKQGKYRVPPPAIVVSPFVSREIAEHLMRNEQTYKAVLTDGEMALRSFVTPLCLIYEIAQSRKIVLGRILSPLDNAPLMKALSLDTNPINGVNYSSIDIPSRDQKKGGAFLLGYNLIIRQHLIYHLFNDKSLPKGVDSEKVLYPEGATLLMRKLFTSLEIEKFNGIYLELVSHTLSLEALFNAYIFQVQSEFFALDALLPQGYVYQIKMKESEMGELDFLFRALAFKVLFNDVPPRHLKYIHASGDIWKLAAPDLTVQPENLEAAIVAHEYCDTKTLNLKEGYENGSDITCVLDPKRKDLLDHLIQV